ncbi:MAG: hypothetical protein Q7J59_03400 [Elusimicrobiota bacterium]|nr:hypothetical protein [Elusimicrobiota bacterium]
MRKKAIEDYSPAHLKKLMNMLAVLYEAVGSISKNLYLVGGLVPDLLVGNKLPYLKEYLGTLDIDIAVKLTVLPKGRYKNFYMILRSMGFEKQKTPDGIEAINHSFIKYGGGGQPIIIDLITDDKLEPRADKLKEISRDVDAVKFRGVYLVFEDFIERKITHGAVTVRIKIPNIIPFLTLKAFTYSDEENRDAKDAYDIWYTIVNFGSGPESVEKELMKYRGNKDVKDGFEAIYRYFDNEASPGTKDVADILVKRYGLGRTFADKEIVIPISQLKKLAEKL